MGDRHPPTGTLAPMSRAFWIETLGCPKNQVDSDKLSGTLLADGLVPAGAPERADLVVVNTCAFIEDARRESVDVILALADRRPPGARLVVTGCMAERYGDELADALPEADAVAGFGVPVTLGATRVAGTGDADTRDAAAEPPALDLLNLPRPPASAPWAYVKVAEGCDRACGFCAIPSFRGPQRSRPFDAVLSEVDGLVASGVREVVLVAQDLAAYGRDREHASRSDGRSGTADVPRSDGRSGTADVPRSDGRSGTADVPRSDGRSGTADVPRSDGRSGTADVPRSDGRSGRGTRQIVPLVEELARRVDRVRLLYLYPSDLTPALVDAVCATGVPYFDLSLQHASGSLLRRMRRWGDGERFLRRIEEIRSREPDAAFRSSFIVGYPGETEADQDQLLDFVAAADLDWAGFFAYSAEEGTYAAGLDGVVEPGLVAERLAELRELQDGITTRKRDDLVGTVTEVLVDASGCARSHREAPEIDGIVTVPDTLPVGDLVKVRIEGASGPDVDAVPV
jgi:tRNA A37 methylthiotransferase MiaB